MGLLHQLASEAASLFGDIPEGIAQARVSCTST